MPPYPITVGATYPTLAAFKEDLRLWAIEARFTTHIRDSDAHRVRAGCRSSPDCPFRIRCSWNSKRGLALVTVIKDEHTCNPEDFDPAAAKRTELTKLTFLREAVPKLMIVDYATTPQDIIEAIKQRYGQEIPVRQAQKVKAVLCPKDRHGCKFCGGPAHRSRRCIQDPLSSATGSNSINSITNEADSGMQVEYEDTTLQNGQNPVMLLQQENTHSTQSTNHVSAYETPRMVPSQGFQAVRQLTGAATLTRDSRAVVAASSQNNPLAEAAEMMKRAAQLMQEAAQLNAEAARLMTSAVPR